MRRPLFIASTLFIIATTVAFVSAYRSHSLIVNTKEYPLIQFDTFISYNMTDKGIDTIVKGNALRHYVNRDEIDNVNIERLNGEIERLSAEKTTYQKSLYTLEKDVLFTKADYIRFETQKASYEPQKKILHSLAPFVLHYNGAKIRGTFLAMDRSRQTIQSQKISITIPLEEEKGKK